MTEERVNERRQNQGVRMSNSKQNELLPRIDESQSKVARPAYEKG